MASNKKKPTPKAQRNWKIITILSCVLAILLVAAIPTLMILDLNNVISLSSDEKRQYSITFKNGSEVQEVRTYDRGYDLSGDKMPISVKISPTQYVSYKFLGWDINNDGVEDSINFKIYYNFDAKAVFQTIKNSGGNK